MTSCLSIAKYHSPWLTAIPSAKYHYCGYYRGSDVDTFGNVKDLEGFRQSLVRISCHNNAVTNTKMGVGMAEPKVDNGSFVELLQRVNWDGHTSTFRFAQLSPTLVLVSGTELPAHYHPGAAIDEYWMVLPGSSAVEVGTSKGYSTLGTWQHAMLCPGEYIYIPGSYSRSARALGVGSFNLLMSLAEPATRLPVDQQRRWGNLR